MIGFITAVLLGLAVLGQPVLADVAPRTAAVVFSKLDILEFGSL